MPRDGKNLQMQLNFEKRNLKSCNGSLHFIRKWPKWQILCISSEKQNMKIRFFFLDCRKRRHRRRSRGTVTYTGNKQSDVRHIPQQFTKLYQSRINRQCGHKFCDNSKQ